MRIFLTGASGFIGGSVATRLVQDGATVNGLVRDATKADMVRHFGITPIIGTLDDTDLLIREARAADAVINAASSDHREAANALGLALSGTGKPMIHTSGSSIVADEANGEPSKRVYSEQPLPIPEPEKEARVALDKAVLNAVRVRGIVLCNSLIYGDALGPTAYNVQLPRLIDEALESGTAHFIGRGLNMWSNVSITHLPQVDDETQDVALVDID
ncbi:MAG: NAD-dependent epimerase/dehydratase family protein [Novosphingobium sp.]